MSQFAFAHELISAVRMDEPLTSGPVPRWQQKSTENCNSSNASNTNAQKSKSRSSKTPKKGNENTKKTPSKTPSKKDGGITPNKGVKTPSGADRFIPERNNFEKAYYVINQVQQPPEEQEMMSPTLVDKQKAMSENLYGCDINSTRILSYQVKAPGPPEGHQNPHKVVYSQAKTPHSSKATHRYIPQAPDRILDAPEIVDDYYLNLMDWSRSNILAVALANSVYLWNAGTGSIEHLLDLDSSDRVCSLSWIQEGEMLGVGTSLGMVQLWDVEHKKRLRQMDGHSARVSSLSWNSHCLSSGCRLGLVVNHDVRQREHIVNSIQAHSQEVCGLKWSLDGRYLATGGNDNMLCIWPVTTGEAHSQSEALFTFTSHLAAVKALAWCPWQSGLLASGGGTADRHIRFWNCNTGVSVAQIDTKSQVCGIVWSTTYKELLSGHGYSKNQLCIWKYPSLTKVTELTGHTARVLHLAISPDGSSVLSAGADETLRLWKCFAPSPAAKKEETKTRTVDSFIKRSAIR